MTKILKISERLKLPRQKTKDRSAISRVLRNFNLDYKKIDFETYEVIINKEYTISLTYGPRSTFRITVRKFKIKEKEITIENIENLEDWILVFLNKVNYKTKNIKESTQNQTSILKQYELIEDCLLDIMESDEYEVDVLEKEHVLEKGYVTFYIYSNEDKIKPVAPSEELTRLEEVENLIKWTQWRLSEIEKLKLNLKRLNISKFKWDFSPGIKENETLLTVYFKKDSDTLDLKDCLFDRQGRLNIKSALLKDYIEENWGLKKFNFELNKNSYNNKNFFIIHSEDDLDENLENKIKEDFNIKTDHYIITASDIEIGGYSNYKGFYIKLKF